MNTNPHPPTGTFSGRRFLASLPGLTLLAFSFEAFAKPEIRQGFFDAYPSAVGSRLDNLPSRSGHCGVCHYRFQGGGARNPYGLLVESNLAYYPKSAAGYRDNNWSLRNVDADDDGYSTLTEVTATSSYSNVPTFPGLTPANVGQVSGISSADEQLIQSFLVPVSTADTTPPSVTAISPHGGETLTANANTVITWTAMDAGGVAAVNLYLSLNDGLTYGALALGLPNTGSYAWFPANRPTRQARVRVVATDNASNRGTNQSAGVFAIVSPPGGRVPTTLRDFDMPGTQPLELTSPITPPSECAACHGNYNPATEPSFNWEGSMMAQASRDPLFEANLTIANQDAPDSGDLCLRCHIYPGWVQGRSVPTSGHAMLDSDKTGVSCDVCHRLVDPVYEPGVSPVEDAAILAALSFPGTNLGNGMLVVDPTASRRGPFADTASPHEVLVSPFHREAALCGSCHDVSNPAFEKNALGGYDPNALDAPGSDFSAHHLAPVERTYSEWYHSAYNTPQGVPAPEFAGNKDGGLVATCQDCHMRDVTGPGCDPAQYPDAPIRTNLPLHDLTGSSTWLPLLLTELYPDKIHAAAMTAGVARATYMLQNAADLKVGETETQLWVTVTNNSGHKLPTGYPEGRRVWLNVRFYDPSMKLLGESGAYDPETGLLTRDEQAKVYEVHPGLDTNVAALVGLPVGPSLHFVLNNRVFEDNRIPPRGFTNDTFASFGGAPVGHHYEDGQYWDDTLYTIPEGATKAEVRLFFQSTSKEFVEFLRDENHTDTRGQFLFDLWNNRGKCPPTLMAEATWTTPLSVTRSRFTESGEFRIDFQCRAGATYTIEYTDRLSDAPVWRAFLNNGTQTPTGEQSYFFDDFTSNTSGGTSKTGARFYRIHYRAVLE
jgi:Bacterial Ig domain